MKIPLRGCSDTARGAHVEALHSFVDGFLRIDVNVGDEVDKLFKADEFSGVKGGDPNPNGLKDV